jgi:hypothetical protein
MIHPFSATNSRISAGIFAVVIATGVALPAAASQPANVPALAAASPIESIVSKVERTLGTLVFGNPTGCQLVTCASPQTDATITGPVPSIWDLLFHLVA